MRQIFGFEARKFPSQISFFIYNETREGGERKKMIPIKKHRRTLQRTMGSDKRSSSNFEDFNFCCWESRNGREEAKRWKNKRLIPLLTSSSSPKMAKHAEYACTRPNYYNVNKMKSTSDQRENKERRTAQTNERKEMRQKFGRANKFKTSSTFIYIRSFVNSYGAQCVCDAFILYFFFFSFAAEWPE